MADDDSRVFLNPEDDPAMQQAFAQARDSFRYFWREMTWENRRIVSGVGFAAVKVEFGDQPTIEMRSAPPVEHMWVSDVDFDGYLVSGRLMNSPNWVTSVKKDDLVRVPLGQISDWMYTSRGRAYGGYTVNLMRSRMAPAEMKSHDGQWGLDFGPSTEVDVIPDYAAEAKQREQKKGFFGRKKHQPVAPSQADLGSEHPMALNMVPAYTKQAQGDPALVHYRDERGWTQLHHFALGGSVVCVQFFLDHGADPRALTSSGLSAAQLAYTLGWNDVVALLQRHGG